MEHKRLIIAGVLLSVLSFGSLFAETEIKLSGRKDLVLSYETRATVLDVAGRHLSEKSDSYLVSTAETESPFSFDKPVEVVERKDEEGGNEPVVEKVINYDDASVLNAVASNFSKQVRGTLARGSTSFLQLNGGNMIKPGTSFPVSIPQAKGQTFEVTISEITSNSYTLQLGSAEQIISLDTVGSSGASTIKVD